MLSSDRSERLARARASLEGLSVGDALGGFFEGATRLPRAIATRTPLSAPWHYTDDTQMALSIVAVLRRANGIDQDQLAQSFAEHYERARGYGPATRTILARIRRGADWRAEAKGIFDGQGSFGNGAGVRVAPLGAYFADNLDAVVEHARRAAEMTHAHPEGIAGSIAVAVAAAWAWHLRGGVPSRQEFFDRILPLTLMVRWHLAFVWLAIWRQRSRSRLPWHRLETGGRSRLRTRYRLRFGVPRSASTTLRKHSGSRPAASAMLTRPARSSVGLWHRILARSAYLRYGLHVASRCRNGLVKKLERRV
jgi:hypothetical protein